MAKGKVKRLISGKGYGFIVADDGQELFFHQSELVEGAFEDLEEGRDVEFETRKGPRGIRAVKVKPM